MNRKEWFDKRDMFAAHAITGVVYGSRAVELKSDKLCVVAIAVGYDMMIAAGYGDAPKGDDHED